MTMRIRALRDAAGMTQMELASSMGVVQNAVSNWENEVCLPRARQLPLLAELLGCKIDDLFYPQDTMEGSD